MQVLNVFLITR